MQFKMAEGSAFAILLRSSWWYSAAIAIFLIMLSFLVFGSQYVFYGVALSLPFIGIAGMAGYRQMQMPSSRRVEEVVEQAREMSARDLSSQMSAAYEKLGYEVAPYKGGAADIELNKGWRRILVCSKRYKAASTGIEPLKSLIETVKREEATGCSYLALGDISATARQFAIDNNIEIINATALTALLDGRVKPD